MGIQVSSTNNTYRPGITEILLKVDEPSEIKVTHIHVMWRPTIIIVLQKCDKVMDICTPITIDECYWKAHESYGTQQYAAWPYYNKRFYSLFFFGCFESVDRYYVLWQFWLECTPLLLWGMSRWKYYTFHQHPESQKVMHSNRRYLVCQETEK
jgi:hypothetical protein